MAKVNPEDLVEVECPRYNEIMMERNRLESSPGLKISVFLGETSQQKYKINLHLGGSFIPTEIICKENAGVTCRYDGGTCFYSNLSRKVSKED